MHSDRSDQSDRGLCRLRDGRQTRRRRPVARQQRSEVVAIAHAREPREDVAQVGERVLAVALTRHDCRTPAIRRGRRLLESVSAVAGF